MYIKAQTGYTVVIWLWQPESLPPNDFFLLPFRCTTARVLKSELRGIVLNGSVAFYVQYRFIGVKFIWMEFTSFVILTMEDELTNCMGDKFSCFLLRGLAGLNALIRTEATNVRLVYVLNDNVRLFIRFVW